MNPLLRRKRMLQVAFLWSRGLRQTEIASLFRCNVRLVNELLKEARALGILERAPKFIPGKCTAREQAELDQLDLGMALRDALQAEAAAAQRTAAQMVHTVHVVSSGGSSTAAAMMLLRVEHFGAGVAPELLAHLMRSRTVGVTWGFTLAGAISAVTRLDCSELRGGDRRFVAMSGEPYSFDPYPASASHLAEKLGEQQRTPDRVLSLRGLPAFIESDYDHEQISRFVYAHTAYGKIFGRSPAERATAVVSQLDCIISSVGAFAPPLSPFVTELVNKSRLPLERLDQLAWGDLGGVLVAKEDLSPENAEEFRRLEKIWIGVRRSDLAATVVRARAQGMPGVVLLALGTNKAGIVRAAARAGLVSEIFLDIPCAIKLAGDLQVMTDR